MSGRWLLPGWFGAVVAVRMIPVRDGRAAEAPGPGAAVSRAARADDGSTAPVINLAAARIRRRQVLGGLSREYEPAA